MLLLGIASYSSEYEILEPNIWKRLEELWDVAHLRDNRLLRPKKSQHNSEYTTRELIWSFLKSRRDIRRGRLDCVSNYCSPPTRSMKVRGQVSAEEQVRIRLERQKKRELKEMEAAALLDADGSEPLFFTKRQRSMDLRDL